MDEELTVKDIVWGNKINELTSKLLDTVDQHVSEKIEEFKSIIDGNDYIDINLACISAVFNMLTSMIAEDIDRKILMPSIVQDLAEDLPIKVNKKLEFMKNTKR